MAIFPGAISTDSDLYIAVNNQSTVLTDNPLTIGATTVNVSSTTGFPTVGFISIDAEIIKYTGKTATSFTGCTRGADGTTAASHLLNAQVDHNVIAAHHNVHKDEIIAVETFISSHIGLTTAVTTAEFERLSGVTSAIQTQLNAKAPTASPTFTGIVVAPTIDVTTISHTGGTDIKGTNTNDDAAAGDVGEYIESVVSSVSFPATGIFGDATSISLTAGDWDVTLEGLSADNASSATANQIGISQTSGNSTVGLVTGSNRIDMPPPTAAVNGSGVIASYRQKLSGTTTIYAKFRATYTGGNPLFFGRLSARRVR